MSKVSVIIPNYNYGAYVSTAIESALQQTLSPHEVIVVDDGSTDHSHEVLAKFQGRIQIIQQKNQGVCAARNAGATQATGDYLAFLDADDYWMPQKLELQMAQFALDPETGLVTCGARYINKVGEVTGEQVEGMFGWVAHELLKLKHSVVVGPGSTSLIPKKVFEEVGGFDADRRLHPSEDWFLSYCIARRYKLGFVPQALLVCRDHGSGAHLKIDAMERATGLAFTRIFNDPDPDLQAIRRECYGNRALMLAGSYFNNGAPFQGVTHLLRSLWLTPGNLGHVLAWPSRRWKRQSLRQQPSALQ